MSDYYKKDFGTMDKDFMKVFNFVVDDFGEKDVVRAIFLSCAICELQKEFKVIIEDVIKNQSKV